jgi:SAM-dependent methyltransferase
MTLSNQHVDRGFVGPTPALTTRADEAYTDFMSDTRNYLLHAHWKGIGIAGGAAMKQAGHAVEHSKAGVEKARQVIGADAGLATFMRIKRSCQEMYKQRIIESFGLRRDELERMLDESDKRGPGSVAWDPGFVYPDYATVDIHISPGGYTGQKLSGLIYDSGTSIFYGGANDGDALHARLAKETAVPRDGKVERILDIGCSCGQYTGELKKRFPQAETIGIDIGSPMVRYAHWRAVKLGLDVHFAQMPSEDLDFPDRHFDLVGCHILFHEIPKPVIERTLAEVPRVLRPGGTFVLWDFGSATPENPGYGGFVGLMDAADNGEPFAPGFVACGVETLMEQAGFTLRSKPTSRAQMYDRICDKAG